MISNDRETVERIAADHRVRVKTRKGASFEGYACGWYYNEHMRHYGLVVSVIRGTFAGTVHVYPAEQLEIVDED